MMQEPGARSNPHERDGRRFFTTPHCRLSSRHHS